jgi:hypothetical protein
LVYDEEPDAEDPFMPGPSEAGFPTGICYDDFEYGLEAVPQEEEGEGTAWE